MAKTKNDIGTLEKKCEALALLINGVSSLYSSSMDDVQKAFIETTIGAAIWYLPKTDESFSGAISKTLLERLKIDADTKISEEHVYPRKIAAKELLEEASGGKTMTTEQVVAIYKNKYCKICYVTQEENKKAIKFQKSDQFTQPDDAYSRAGITFVEISKEQVKELRRGMSSPCDSLVEKGIKISDLI